MKMLKIILIAFIGLLVLSAVSMAVDYYLYSWTSFVRPFGCEYKSVRVIYQQEGLEQNYNLAQIATELQLNSNYKIEAFQNESQLIVSRLFNRLTYNIRIEKGKTSNGSFTKILFHNSNEDINENSLINKGEKPTTPNYYIEKNIYQMINEMPLNDAQKSELKSKVQITCSPKTKLSF